MFLEINNIKKQYEQKDAKPVTVLSDINLKINEGEFVSILGPSGCGKSTLLSIVAGLNQPTDGDILLQGKKITKPGPDRGMVFQQAALFPWMSVLENVMFGLRKKMTKQKAQDRAREFLKMVQLGKYLKNYPHELSGGMQQRVSIARALSMDPTVLLMDEPFGALDEQTRTLLHKELEKIWIDTKKTILFVTHSITESIKLSDRIIVMGTQPGTIMADITVDLPRPRHEYKEEMLDLENQVMEILEKEIDKVVREEFKDEASA